MVLAPVGLAFGVFLLFGTGAAYGTPGGASAGGLEAAFVVYTVIVMGPAVWLVVAAAVLRGLGRQARFGAVFLGLVYLYLGGYVCIPPLAHALDALAG